MNEYDLNEKIKTLATKTELKAEQDKIVKLQTSTLRSEISLTDGSMGKNIITFGVNMISSVHIYNKEKDILILGRGPGQGLDDTTSTAEAQYSINFSRSNKKYCLSLHYNWINSFLLVNATKILKYF